MQDVTFQIQSIILGDRAFEISCFIHPGNEEILLYLHGLGSTKYDFFEAVYQTGLKDFTLIAFDFPGCGNSRYLDEMVLKIDDLVEITHRMYDALNIADATLIGHSMGGLTALLFTQKYPDQVKRLIDIEGNVSPEDCGVLSRRTSDLRFDEFIGLNFLESIQQEYAQSPYLGARIFSDTFRKNVAEKAFYEYCVSIVQHSDNDDLLSTFKGLDIPKLFLYGDANNNLSYIPELTGKNMHAVEVPRSHHWLHHDNRTFFYRTIQEFISSS